MGWSSYTTPIGVALHAATDLPVRLGLSLGSTAVLMVVATFSGSHGLV
jgi:hypothetical protein